MIQTKSLLNSACLQKVVLFVKAESPSKFYVVSEHEQKSLNSLRIDLEEHYSKCKAIEKPYNPVSEGDLCVLKDNNEVWRRVQVEFILDVDADVRDVDTGELLSCIPINSLHELDPPFNQKEFLAIPCRLDGVYCKEESLVWSNRCLTNFRGILKVNKVYTVETLGWLAGICCIKVFLKNNTSIADVLLNLGLVGSVEDQSDTETENPDVNQMRLKLGHKSIPKSQFTSLISPSKNKGLFNPNGLDIGLEEEELVIVNEVLNPNCFWVTLLKSFPSIEELENALADMYSTSPSLDNLNHDWLQEGKYYAMKFPQGMWKRGCLIKIQNNLSFLFCLDYGYTRTFEAGELRPLSQKFQDILPYQAIPCTISISPHYQFSQEHLKYFEGLLNSVEVIKATFLSCTSSGLYEVELGGKNKVKPILETFMSHTQQHLMHCLRAVSRNKKNTSLSGHSPRHELVTKFLGGNSKKNSKCGDVVDIKATDSDEIRSGEDKRCSMDESAVRKSTAGDSDFDSCSTNISKSKREFQVSRNSVISPKNNLQTNHFANEDKNSIISDNNSETEACNKIQKKNEFLQIEDCEFEIVKGDRVSLTAFHSTSDFYITLPSAKKKFEKMMSSLFKYGQECMKDEKKVKGIIKEGELVAACLEGKWCRGRVEKLLKGYRRCLVFFVDLGKCEVVKKFVLLPERFCTWLPRNCLHCSLDVPDLVNENLFVRTFQYYDVTILEVKDCKIDSKQILKLKFPTPSENDHGDYKRNEVFKYTNSPSPTKTNLKSLNNNGRSSQSKGDSPNHYHQPNINKVAKNASPNNLQPSNNTTTSSIVPFKKGDEVVIVFIEDTQLFYMHLTQVYTPCIEKITQLLYSHSLQTSAPKSALNPGDIVAALFEDVWSRAQVLYVLAASQIMVKFTDFGNISTVCLNETRLLPDDLASHAPSAVVPCALAGVNSQSIKRKLRSHDTSKFRDSSCEDDDEVKDEDEKSFDKWFKENCECRSYMLESLEETVVKNDDDDDYQVVYKVDLFCPDRKKFLSELLRSRVDRNSSGNGKITCNKDDNDGREIKAGKDVGSSDEIISNGRNSDMKNPVCLGRNDMEDRDYDVRVSSRESNDYGRSGSSIFNGKNSKNFNEVRVRTSINSNHGMIGEGINLGDVRNGDSRVSGRTSRNENDGKVSNVKSNDNFKSRNSRIGSRQSNDNIKSGNSKVCGRTSVNDNGGRVTSKTLKDDERRRDSRSSSRNSRSSKLYEKNEVVYRDNRLSPSAILLKSSHWGDTDDDEEERPLSTTSRDNRTNANMLQVSMGHSTNPRVNRYDDSDGREDGVVDGSEEIKYGENDVRRNMVSKGSNKIKDAVERETDRCMNRQNKGYNQTRRDEAPKRGSDSRGYEYQDTNGGDDDGMRKQTNLRQMSSRGGDSDDKDENNKIEDEYYIRDGGTCRSHHNRDRKDSYKEGSSKFIKCKDESNNKKSNEQSARKLFKSDLPKIEMNGAEILSEVVVKTCPCDFWCHDLNAMVKLSPLILDTSTQLSYDHIPQLEEVCLGYHSEYNEWYRMCVEGVDKNKMEAQVHIIDYGDRCTVSWKHLKNLPTILATFPPLAFHCALDGFELPNSGSKREAVRNKFASLVENEICYVNGRMVNSKYHVEIITDKKINVKKELSSFVMSM